MEDHPDAYKPGTRDHEQDGNDEIGRRCQAAAEVEPLGVRPTHEPETNDENDESERLDFRWSEGHGETHRPRLFPSPRFLLCLPPRGSPRRRTRPLLICTST